MKERRQMFSQILVVAIVLAVGGTVLAGPPGLVGYWTFDEGQGKVAHDSSGNGLDGTLNGNPQWVIGQVGGALDFNGSTDYVEIPDDPRLALTTGITIAAWTNMRATASGEMAILSKGGWAANDLPYELTEERGGVIFWQFYNDAGRDSCSPDSPTADEWHHLAATYDGEVFKCYIDGVLAEEWAYAGTMPQNTASVTIGCRSRGGTFFNGMIDDVALYERALDQEEVLSIMEGHLQNDPLAQSPTPRNGAMIEQKGTTLKWRAGTFAQLHEVYFGEDFEKVSAATPADTDVFVGRQATVLLPVGLPGGAYPDGLVPGTTYYWRVDEVNDARPESPWKGNVWSFQVQPLTAWKPWPLDGMGNVDLDQDMSWEKGMGVIFHQIYFGDDFDEVNNATSTVWMSVNPTYDPGPLELDKTYYWRIDEFAGAATHKGPVWSFTTRGSGGGVKAEYFQGMDLAGDPVLTQTEGSIDHAWNDAEVAGGLADQVSARWTADLQVPLSETYQLVTASDDGVRLWLDGRLVIDNWTDHGTTENTANVALVAGQHYSIRMEWYDNTGGATAQLFWQSATVPRQVVPQGWLQLPLWATAPYPTHDDVDTPQDLVLQWLPGDGAAEHDVYFGTDAESVANADTGSSVYQGRQDAAETTFDPGPLEWNQTYYWRVDEIDPAQADSPRTGSVWSFTTADFLVVEGFELYTDDEGSRIYETWIDGYADQSSGSTVGYISAPFAEQRIVHSGRQSMPLEYSNADPPYYSEAQRTWDTPQDWTVEGVDTLTLYFQGKSSNDAEKLYVTLEDSAGKTATVVHPDPAAAQVLRWTEWQIPLADFAGVNAARIEKMTIGLGNRSQPAKGGTGLIYLDDIRVVKP